MVFYEIELQGMPEILFACSVDLLDYHNRFSYKQDFLEICLVEEGDIQLKNKDNPPEIVKAGSLESIFSDMDIVTCALRGERQRHTTVGVQVKYALLRHTTEEPLELAALRRRVREKRALLIPYNEPMGNCHASVLTQIKRIISLHQGAEPCSGIKATVAWLSLCELLTEFVLERLEDRGSKLSPAGLRYAERAMAYIRAHYRERITVREVAEELGISEGYLHVILQAAVGMGITEYANAHRVELAKQLILSRDLSLVEISEAVGVSDPAYMSRLFKKVSGVGYREYKRALLAKKSS